MSLVSTFDNRVGGRLAKLGKSEGIVVVVVVVVGGGGGVMEWG